VSEEKPKKLTPDEWSECRSLYELGEARTTELSERFGVSKQAISKHFKDNAVIFGSRKKEHDEKVAKATSAAVAAKTASFESTRKQKIEETKTESYAMIRAIQIQSHKLWTEAVRAGASIASVQGEMKTLRMAAAIQEQARQGRYAILNVDRDVDEASLPILPIEDLSNEEIRSLQDTGLDDGLDDLPSLEDDVDEVIETS
jgi:hypothetical protein